MKKVADRQIRNRATLGGSICAAHPASDITAVLMTLNAAVRLVSATGERLVDLRDFIAGAFSTTARPDELLQEVVVPVPAAPRWGAAYCRFALRGGDYPVVGAGVFAGHDDGGRCQQARIVLGNCQGAPTRALEAEQRLQGCDPVADDQAVAEAAERAAAYIELLDEPMASGAYKKDLVRVLAREALEAAVARALAT
jgi:CO/xanthine dehydrogenase FAD-binding subunit